MSAASRGDQIEGDDGYANALIDFFLASEDLAAVDSAVARALCYWPVYCTMLARIRADVNLQQRISTWIKRLDIRKSCTFIPRQAITVEEASDEESSRYVHWPTVLGILLSASCNSACWGDQQVAALLKEGCEDLKGVKYGFYYRFAVAFQGWISSHITSPLPHWATSPSPICRDCRARAEASQAARLIVDFFYNDVIKSRAAFRAIFGICARDISLAVRDGASERVIKQPSEAEFNSPILTPVAEGHPLPYGPDQVEIVKRLWGELIWMMWEIEDLAFVRSNIADHERTVHEYITTNTLDFIEAKSNNIIRKDAVDESRSAAAVAAFERMFQEVIYPNLRPFQFTLFVRTAVSDHETSEDEVIRFDTHRTLQDLGIRLPAQDVQTKDSYWSGAARAKAIDRLNEVVGKLYEKGFKKNFFSRLKEAKLSSAHPERTFPFILFPDGEIALYYALNISERGQSGAEALSLKDIMSIAPDALSINAVVAKPNDARREAIWEPGSVPYGLLPDSEFPMHHKCAALVGAARMLVEEPRPEDQDLQEAGNLILQTFCNNQRPVDYVEKVLKNRQFAAIGLSAAKPRIEWEPDLMIRLGDPQCYTLFFLPIGSDKHGVPTAMVAGTLRGVEVRWLPFSSARMVAYLLPLAYILRPLLDRMVHGVFLQQALKAAQVQKERDFRLKLEGKITNLFEQIDQVALSATRIQAEVAPAPLRMFGAQTRALEKLFRDNETTIIDSSVLADLEIDPTALSGLRHCILPFDEGATQRWQYRAVHGSGGTDGVPVNHKTETAKSLVIAAASVMQSGWLRERFFRPLFKEIVDDKSADDVFRILKRALHRYHSARDRQLSVGDLLVLLRLCALEVQERYDGNLVLKVDGCSVDLDSSWLDSWGKAKDILVSINGGPRSLQTSRTSKAEPPTPAQFFGAIARLLTEEMKFTAEGSDRADIREVNLCVKGSQVPPVLEIRFSGNGHLGDLDEDDGREHGLRDTLTALIAAVGGKTQPPLPATDLKAIESIDSPFIAVNLTQKEDYAASARTILLRLRIPLA